MAGEKKRRGRRAYLDDFQKTATGEYVYNGKLHYYGTEQKPRKKALVLLWVLTVVMAVMIVAGGCTPAAGMSSCPYVVLPYAGSLLAVGSIVWLMCRLSAGGDPLRDYVWQATVKQFAPRGWLAVIFGGCTLAGDVVYLICSGVGSLLAGTILFLVEMTIYLVAALAWKIAASRLIWSN